MNDLLNKVITQIAQPIEYLLFALAIVYFLYGVMVFIRNADAPEKRAEGFQHIIWGLIGLFIMVSAVGIINIILGTISR
jgi:4-hydroxybenzoate polyprenyltransferase